MGVSVSMHEVLLDRLEELARRCAALIVVESLRERGRTTIESSENMISSLLASSSALGL